MRRCLQEATLVINQFILLQDKHAFIPTDADVAFLAKWTKVNRWQLKKGASSESICLNECLFEMFEV